MDTDDTDTSLIRWDFWLIHSEEFWTLGIEAQKEHSFI